MTVPTTLDRVSLMSERLALLRTERDELLRETLLEPTGDLADRATNVEATIRLGLIDERIAALEVEIADCRRHRHTDGIVSVGDVVTLDLGDGDETYLVGSVEEAAAGIDTITPLSALGRAIVGAQVGTTVSYQPRPGVTLPVEIRAAGELLAPSA